MKHVQKEQHLMLHDPLIALASARQNITGINLQPSLILAFWQQTVCGNDVDLLCLEDFDST
jgi:hypothetical protein